MSARMISTASCATSSSLRLILAAFYLLAVLKFSCGFSPSSKFGTKLFHRSFSRTVSTSRRSTLAAAVNGDSGSSSDKAKTGVDWSRADSSSQIFPGGPGLSDRLGRQSGYTTSSPYSRTLSRRKKKIRRNSRTKRFLDRIRGNNINNDDLYDVEIQEDGYDQMYHKKQPRWKRFGKKLLRRKDPEPGNLILVRHGESSWNANKTFTGWADPDLSPQGFREVEHAARLLLESGYVIDIVFTSRLKRAIRSVWILLQELNEVYLPVFKSWRLNERMYGALTGLSKSETAEQLGTELVQEWRGSLRTRPPAVVPGDQYWPGVERRYADVSAADIPVTESLLDCMGRTEPVWNSKIKKQLMLGRNILVVAHANTLRGLVKIIDNIGDDEIQDVAIPTGIPIVYKFDENMNPVAPPPSSGCRQAHMSGLFLEKPGLLKEAMKREADWCAQVPGYSSTMQKTKTPMSTKERSLNKLNAQRQLGKWAGQFIEDHAPHEDDGSDGNMGKPIAWIEDEVWEEGIKELEEGIAFDPDFPEFHSNTSASGPVVSWDDEDDDLIVPTIIKSSSDAEVCMKSLPAESVVPGISPSSSSQSSSVIVLIRHGKTEHNKLGLFTGWEDVPLAEDGVEEAKEAGRLLKQHGFEFDVVYVSWLSRAIDTALYVLDELDCLWLPIIKSWRLNERMYGSLTGLSKKMVAQRHGEEQFKAWRRGYKVRPPPVSSFSPNYPGNDIRYTKYMDDVRFSVSESLIRSIEGKDISLQRKLPKSESLYDCMARTIPFYKEAIHPEAIAQGKRVLISSSENAIRGLLMHLCEIPEEKVTELEIPNGLPLIYDLNSKCLKLLDDGSGQDPLEKYNFGKAGKFLFRNCNVPEECGLVYGKEQVQISQEDAATIEFLRNPKAASEKEEVAV